MEKKKYNKKKHSEYCKEYYKKNKKQMVKQQSEYHKLRRKVDKVFSLKEVVRTQTKEKYNGKKVNCRICGINEPLEFHHSVYKTPVEEEDFIVVCKKCHKKIHMYVET